jgi:uncharacterized membrane protein (DUF441 family)
MVLHLSSRGVALMNDKKMIDNALILGSAKGVALMVTRELRGCCIIS